MSSSYLNVGNWWLFGAAGDYLIDLCTHKYPILGFKTTSCVLPVTNWTKLSFSLLLFSLIFSYFFPNSKRKWKDNKIFSRKTRNAWKASIYMQGTTSMETFSYMFGPMTITIFDASERKRLLGCKKKKIQLHRYCRIFEKKKQKKKKVEKEKGKKGSYIRKNLTQEIKLSTMEKYIRQCHCVCFPGWGAFHHQ